jgi:hypothetical protein
MHGGDKNMTTGTITPQVLTESFVKPAATEKKEGTEETQTPAVQPEQADSMVYSGNESHKDSIGMTLGKKLGNSKTAKWFFNTISAFDRKDATVGQKLAKVALEAAIGATVGVALTSAAVSPAVLAAGSAVILGTMLGAAGFAIGGLFGGFAHSSEGASKWSKIGGLSMAALGGLAGWSGAKESATQIALLVVKFGGGIAGGAAAGAAIALLHTAYEALNKVGSHKY